ncbi:DUF6104 family protein [Streptomyces mirabilis]|uniref:DUF6104 family protein n=1 Tax=Streptomyces mirabilis TaxID=68239 RepID=UPI0036B4B61C
MRYRWGCYFTHRGIEELKKRHSEEEVTYKWLPARALSRRSRVPSRSSPASWARSARLCGPTRSQH